LFNLLAEFLGRLANAISVEGLTTFSSLISIAYSFSYAGQQPYILLRLCPYLVAKVIKTKTRGQYLVNLMSLLNYIPGQQHILVEHMNAAGVTHGLLQLFAQKQIGYKDQFQMTWILSKRCWMLHADNVLNIFNHFFNLV
jgi:hypothetical protein